MNAISGIQLAGTITVHTFGALARRLNRLNERPSAANENRKQNSPITIADGAVISVNDFTGRFQRTNSVLDPAEGVLELVRASMRGRRFSKEWPRVAKTGPIAKIAQLRCPVTLAIPDDLASYFTLLRRFAQLRTKTFIV